MPNATRLGSRRAYVVDVGFGRPGSGGVHDVVLCEDECDATSIWRSWEWVGDILAVGRVSHDAGERRFRARWFSRHGEIELCGSGAVALGGCLLQREPRSTAAIDLLGEYHDIPVERDDGGVRIFLPKFELQACAPDSELMSALGIRNNAPVWICGRLRTHIICVDRGVDLSVIEPDLHRLARIVRPDLEAVIITGLQDEASAFAFRYFTPWHGLVESPVAASANALLGTFWHARTSNTHLTGWQRSAQEPTFELEVNETGTWLKGDFVATPRSDAGVTTGATTGRQKKGWG